jgi:hypothetical protein
MSSNMPGFAAAGPVLDVSVAFTAAVVWAGAVVATNANASKAAANGSVVVLIAGSSFRWFRNFASGVWVG